MMMQRFQLEDKLFDQQAKKQQALAEKQMQQYQEFFAFYGKGVAQSVAASLFFGESFEKSIGLILKSLAIEAGARAIMETAMGFASVAVGDGKGAIGHFTAAAIFGSAATASAVGANLLGAGGSGGSSGATASPTGAPQVATAPQREQAESREMVFNLNFGGAVIYDTKEAAKRAMIGDIVRTYNGNNRGMPRFNFAR
jgi:hypothetical protein